MVFPNCFSENIMAPMTSNRLRKTGGIFLISLIVFLGTYKLIIAAEIRSMFQRQGFDTIELYVDSIGLSSATFKGIVIGDDEPLQIGEAHFKYSLGGLLRHHIDSITLENVTIDAHFKNQALFTQVLGNFINDFIPQHSTSLLPAYLFNPKSFFFDTLTISKSALHINGKEIDVTVPFQLSLHNDKKISLQFDASAPFGKAMGYSLSGNTSTANLVLDNTGHWSGNWKSSITPKHEVLMPGEGDLPVFNASGDLAITSSGADIKIVLETIPSFANIAAKFHMEKHRSYFTVQDVHRPWAGGIRGVHNLTSPVDSSPIINLSLELRNVALADLLHVLISPDIAATGHVSGKLPMGITHSGSLILYRWSMHTEEEGVISIPVDLIPNDATGSKRWLKKLHYKSLDIEVQSGEGNNVAITLALVGKRGTADKDKPSQFNIPINVNILDIIKKINNQSDLSKQNEPKKRP